MSDIFVGGTNGTMAQLKYNYRDYSFRHHQPLSFGLTVRKEFAHGLSLESGVNYTLLWSDVRMQSGREDISQKLHFIGVPLRLNWQFLETGRFSMYVGAGGMLEKCVSAKFGSKSVDEPKVQWSVAGGRRGPVPPRQLCRALLRARGIALLYGNHPAYIAHRFFPVADPPSRSAPFILTFN